MTGSNSFSLLAQLAGRRRRRRDADILLEVLLSEGSRKSVSGEGHPQHRWWARHVTVLVRMVLGCRTMEAVNGAKDHLSYLGPSHAGMSKP